MLKKPIHLSLLKNHYFNACIEDKDDNVSINVREDNILKYRYTIKPLVSNGELTISYLDSNTIQIKCTHNNRGKLETLYFKYHENSNYDEYSNTSSTFDISIKDVVYAVKDICCKKPTRKRAFFEGDTENTPDSNNNNSDCSGSFFSKNLRQCEIDFNQYKRRKF
ncbi:hypothetical protein QEN19_002026 [Hanseniaspora menglaensis]